jgi:hypothetical protein
LKTEPSTRENGSKILGRAEALKFGQMARCTKVTGVKVKPTVEEDLSMLMVMSTMATGKMTKLTERESIHT